MKKQGWFLFALVTLMMLPAVSIQAKLLQILHTNDLHGLTEHSIFDAKVGGYASIKTILDREKANAAKEGIQTLTLDGGDFLEGNISYFAQNGRRNLELMSLMGYDAVVIGNHDWLMGTKQMGKLLKDSPPKFALLGSNFRINPFYTNIKKNMQSYKIFDIGGVKVAVVGVTTKEVFYSWIVKKSAKIKSQKKTFNKIAKELVKSGKADHVIALTHIGHLEDIKLAKYTKYVDLVVGGHSHYKIEKPIYVRNKRKRDVGVVQTGAYGEFVGRLLVDLQPGKGLRIVKYDLIPVKSVKKDPVVNAHIQETRQILDDEYGKRWLEEVVGHADIPLLNTSRWPSTWSHVIADAMRESIDAEISVHLPDLTGVNLPAGPITREDLFNTYPRVFDFKDRKGWHVYKVKVLGGVLKLVAKYLAKSGKTFSVSGMTFDIVKKAKTKSKKLSKEEQKELLQKIKSIDSPEDLNNVENIKYIEDFIGSTNSDNFKYKVKNMRINGKKLKRFKLYTLAMPEGIVKGGLGITKLVGKILRQIQKTDITIWDALVNKVKKTGTIDYSYARGNRTDFVSRPGL